MVKFSKEYEAKLIPEWKHAFMCYKLLKKQVKKIKSSKNKPMHAVVHHHTNNCNFVFDPIKAFLWRKITGLPSCNDHKNHDIIQVKSNKINTGEGGEEVLEVYETELGQLFSVEYEVKMFFEMLDNELNKVNQFYKTKENEFLERAEILNKQLQILLDLKLVLNEHHRTNLNGSVGLMSHSNSSIGCGNSDFSDQTQSVCCDSPIDSQTDDVIATQENNESNLTKMKNGKPKMGMRIDVPATTPTRGIAAVTSKIWEDLLKSPEKNGGGRESINGQKKIQCAEKMIRGAYVELYRGLGLLKTYSSLNMMAFSKILKKFDKVAKQHASESYLKVVKQSNFITSDKVVRLMDEVDSLFTQHFANNDRKKTMKFLRPKQRKNSHMVTFFGGLFTGSFLSLFGVYGVLTHLSGMFSGISEVPYMETMYHVFSIFALLSLHLFVYGCNLFMWKRTRINCNFIFEFQPNTALNYRDAFLISTCLMTTVVGSMILHLIFLSTGFSAKRVDLIPGILLLCFALILMCPLNVFYRPTRYCFIRLVRNTVCSPFYKVLFVDVFVGDQLTSQTTLLKHIESAACYFLAGSLKTHNGQTCKSKKLFRELKYIFSIAPYCWRALQCGRRWFDEGNRDHLVNMGKYVSTMVAVGARVAYARDPSIMWLITVLVTSLVATIYQLYWDFVKDWGLLDPKSKNRWLRDDLMLKNKASIYYVSIALNFVLRVTWVETVLNLNTGLFESRWINFLLASLEVIRRGQWNFYRLENEHLSNVVKFRAVRAVSLPFRDTDSDGVV